MFDTFNFDFMCCLYLLFFNYTPTTEIYTLSLHDALPISSSVRLKPLNCSRLPCVYAQETLTFLLTQKKTCVKNNVRDRKSGSAGMPRPISYAVFCLKKKNRQNTQKQFGGTRCSNTPEDVH